ncbi:hypothetical protein [Gymnodinialimonas ulvae]|uniref:hypothetical protein n=1 Tax=Gymnodinialimonas ulvae TaxID=3126504 RepID=UPI0030B4AECD
MKTVADYAVLSDGNRILETGDSWRTPFFERPEDFVTGTNLARAILSFNMGALSDPPFAPSVDLTITHEGTQNREVFRSVFFNGTGPFTIQETFPATDFPSVVNTRFRFDVQRGRVVISDIVLWYQLRI